MKDEEIIITVRRWDPIAERYFYRWIVMVSDQMVHEQTDPGQRLWKVVLELRSELDRAQNFVRAGTNGGDAP